MRKKHEALLKCHWLYLADWIKSVAFLFPSHPPSSNLVLSTCDIDLDNKEGSGLSLKVKTIKYLLLVTVTRLFVKIKYL